MPRPKKDNWSRVTITMSDEVIRALRFLGALDDLEMGEEADRYLRAGGLLERSMPLMERLAEHTDAPAPVPFRTTFVDPRFGKDPRGKVSSAPLPPPPPPPKEARRGDGDAKLFAWVETLTHNGKVSQAEVAAAVGITTANYRASWRASKWVPAAYIADVRAFLEEKGFPMPDPIEEPQAPAQDSEA